MDHTKEEERQQEAQALRPGDRRRFQVRPASTTRQATAEGITGEQRQSKQKKSFFNTGAQ